MSSEPAEQWARPPGGEVSLAPEEKKGGRSSPRARMRRLVAVEIEQTSAAARESARMSGSVILEMQSTMTVAELSGLT